MLEPCAPSTLRRPHGLRSLGVFLVCAVLVGCGHKATEAECQLLIDRNVELQMKALNNADPATIEKKQEEVRREMKDALRSECLGRRVTDDMMSCVRAAKTTDEIAQCVR